jgi:hypothetical protein
VRNAIVAEYAETKPQLATEIWPQHPASELWSGLTQIGLAARARKPVGAPTLDLIRNAAIKSPLAPEPFLVRGVEAQLAGNRALALQAFLAAKLRDGRSIPARYFLAEQYFRGGDPARGLRETAVLARMVPNGVDNLAPFVAAYARDGRSRPQLLALFRSDPNLEQSALSVLAADPANAGLIFELASPARKPPQWAARLLETLINAGEYQQARAAWSRVSHVALAPDQLIYDADFASGAAPPPFNWTLASSTVGLAERQGGGRLHLLYYGQEDGPLASQLLVLAPGRYRVAMRVSGDLAHARSLALTMTCVRSSGSLMILPLNDSERARQGVSFDVPDGCAAQTLRFTGTAADLPQPVELTVSGLQLTRDRANG